MTTGFTFLTTGFKLTMGCSFSLTMVFKCPWGRVQKWTPPLPTAAHFQTGSKIKQGIPAAPTVPEPLVFSGFPNILFMPFVSIKRFTFPRTRLRLKTPAHLHNPLVSVSAWKCLRFPLPARHHGLNAYITLYCIAAVSLVLTSCLWKQPATIHCLHESIIAWGRLFFHHCNNIFLMVFSSRTARHSPQAFPRSVSSRWNAL